jgi:hypothetical protein
VIKVTEKERLNKKLLELLAKQSTELTIEERFELGREIFKVQTRLGQIIPEQNAGRLYEDNDEGR